MAFPGYRRLTSQKGRERICNHKFSTVNALRKGRLEACSYRATCLKCSPTEGNMKASMVDRRRHLTWEGDFPKLPVTTDGGKENLVW